MTNSTRSHTIGWREYNFLSKTKYIPLCFVKNQIKSFDLNKKDYKKRKAHYCNLLFI